MGLIEEIKQDWFKTEFHKSVVNVFYTGNWVQDEHIPIFRAHGLTTPQFNVLRILRGQYPKPSTVNLIIDRMLDKSSNASRIVDKLEAKGLVIRKQCAKDRRAVDVFISKRGLTTLDIIDVEMQTLHEQIMVLSLEEQRQLNYLLDKMRNVKSNKAKKPSSRASITAQSK